MYKTILAYKNIYYKCYQYSLASKEYLTAVPLVVGKSIEDLESLLQTADRKKDTAILSVVKRYWRKEILPQYLAAMRLVIGAAVAFMLLDYRVDNGLFIAPLFLIGVASYFIQQVLVADAASKTLFEKIIEPMADQMLILPVMFYSLIVYNEALLFLMVLAEIINATVSLFALDNHLHLGQNIFAKTKMTLQSLVFLVALAFWPATPNMVFVGILWLSLIFMAISIIFKAVSIIFHFQRQHATAKPQTIQHAFGEKRIIEAH